MNKNCAWKVEDNGCTSWNRLNRNRLKKLITWCTQYTTFQFNNKFYQQLDDVAMGSPIGSLMAVVIMNHVVDKALDLTPPSHRPNFFCRYVDDCFATFPNPTSIDIFLTNLNNIHSQIQFTKELEIHNSLTFLDVFKEKTNRGIKTSAYHKPTKTNLLTKYTSFSPLHYKRNLVNNLLPRSYSICNSYTAIDSEFQSIKDTLPKKRIPTEFYRQMHPRIFQQKVQPKTPQTNPNKTFNLSTL